MDSTIWLYIALGIFVLGLIIAIVGVVMLISGIKEPMKKMKGSANNLKERVDKLNLEATTLSHTANELKEDVQVKSEKIGVLVDAAKGTMNSVIDLNATVRSITGDITTRVDRDKRNIAEVNQYSNTAIGLVNMIKNRKSPEKINPTYSPTSMPDVKEY
ncbi:DUF948 domain-containing protein [Planococcus wigleyi]|uniref:DUF948 domain-containing protein n=1 Tax=Planococcus wigleyi TaxID=2762216 RepID=A0ABR8WF10_9BACL|nr:DUF948 domain-containing protein [Planococcus wigleyi]MBD8015552.1 DUF948 domain-containing protein [Planococcus wigleyi]MBF6634613.1 DUF948 domain-containing protein [Planococcus sp. (in: firmicutes)]